MTPVELSIFGLLTAFVFLSAIAVRRVLTTAAVQPSLRSLKYSSALATSDSQPSIPLSDAFDRWMVRLVDHSGLSVTAIGFMTANACLATVLGFGLWSFGANEIVVIIAAVTTLLLGWVTLRLLIKRRQRAFTTQFPGALELISRSVRVGESLEDALELSAKISEQPVKRELNFCSKQLRMGVAVPATMQLLAQRMPTMETRIFAHTISMHRETGGRLSETLERLAKVIRDRSDYLLKIKTMTAMGRFSAVMIGYLGVAILTYLLIVHPAYISKLFESPFGRKLAIYAAVSEIVGIVWVALTLNSDE
jgi:tight adherence protein B